MIVFFVGVSFTFISIIMLYFMLVELMACMTFKHLKGYRMSKRMIFTLRAKAVKIDGLCDMIRLQGLAPNDNLLFLLFSVHSTFCLLIVKINAQYDTIRLQKLAHNYHSLFLFLVIIVHFVFSLQRKRYVQSHSQKNE